MSFRVSDMPAEMRKLGLTVVEVAGCYGRGNDFPRRPRGKLRHWTAGGRGDKPSLGIVTFGRGKPGDPNYLPGPLAQTLQSRERDANGLDVVYFVADGKANHAGTGEWNGVSGNYEFFGNEIEWSGPNEFFPSQRELTSELIARAMLNCCVNGGDPDMAAEHREYARPIGRKIDTNLDGNKMRRRMAELDQAPPTPEEEDDMKPEIITYEGAGQLWITDDWVDCRKITPEHAGGLVWLGRAAWNPDTNAAWVWPRDMIEALHDVAKDPAPFSYWKRHDSADTYKIVSGGLYRVLVTAEAFPVDSYLAAMGGIDVTVHVAGPDAAVLAWFDDMLVLDNADDGTGIVGGLTYAEAVKAAREGVDAELGFLKPNK